MRGDASNRIVDTGAGPIHVRSVGSGPPIVFCHGNSCSSRGFEKQLGSELATQFRLIAIDLPGHGDSPPATAPATTYCLDGYANALAAAASALDATDAVFVGWSLGGHVVLEASDRLPRAAGYLIFGTPPVVSFAEFMQAAYEHPALGVGFRADSTDDEIRELVSLFVRPGTPAPDRFVEDFRRTDKRARASLAESAGRGELRDERRIVAELARPLAVLHGAHDQLIRRTYFETVAMPTLWRGALQELPDAGHAPQWESPEAFNRLLAELAGDCFRG